MKKISLLLMVVLFTSCIVSPMIKMRVETFSTSTGLSDLNVHIIPGNEGTETYDLEFQQYATYIYNGITMNGNRPTELASADIVIKLYYENIGPHVISDTKYNWDYDEKKDELSTTSYIDSETVFITTIMLEAFDGDKYRDDRLEQMWKTTITRTYSRNSLRADFPKIIASTINQLGKSNSSSSENQHIYEQEVYDQIIKEADFSQLYN